MSAQYNHTYISLGVAPCARDHNALLVPSLVLVHRVHLNTSGTAAAGIGSITMATTTASSPTSTSHCLVFSHSLSTDSEIERATDTCTVVVL